MMNDIKNRLVGTVIVKDMSRLGRNYLMVGQYVEIDFPKYDVRFIAISDNVDSAKGMNDLLPINNLMNEWYSRDISKKIRSMVRQKETVVSISHQNCLMGITTLLKTNRIGRWMRKLRKLSEKYLNCIYIMQWEQSRSHCSCRLKTCRSGIPQENTKRNCSYC